MINLGDAIDKLIDIINRAFTGFTNQVSYVACTNLPYSETATRPNSYCSYPWTYLAYYRMPHARPESDALLARGSMYNICNANLLFHASVPLDADGRFREVRSLPGGPAAGKELLERVEELVRTSFDPAAPAAEHSAAVDYFWYLWCGPDSPLFDKSRMATFERYFLADPATHAETKGWYYKLRDDAAVCDYILDAFGVHGPHRHIINGHVPVRVGKGENPIKAGGRLMVIDGGFAKAYHDTTGIAGYTLVYHSRGFQLVQHEPFTSTAEAIREGTDIKSTTQIVEMTGKRAMVADTDIGRELREQITDLRSLLVAYRRGLIKEAH